MEAEFRRLVEDYDKAGEVFDRLLAPLQSNFSAYVRRTEMFAAGQNMPPGLVPQTTYWLVRNQRTIVGMGRLRHILTTALEREGGHIGYTIRPTERRKGYGTKICTLLLEKAREDLRLTKALITCDTDNTPSARIIQKNGGRFVGEMISLRSGKMVSRYWVTLE